MTKQEIKPYIDLTHSLFSQENFIGFSWEPKEEAGDNKQLIIIGILENSELDAYIEFCEEQVNFDVDSIMGNGFLLISIGYNSAFEKKMKEFIQLIHKHIEFIKQAKVFGLEY